MATNNTLRTAVYDVEIGKFYSAILDYGNYPKFIEGVDDIEVLEQSESSARVRYSLNVVKRFVYTLALTHTPNSKVSWKLESGDLFKTNEGEWILKDLGDGQTEVTYSIELAFKLMVPKMILKKLVGSNLPAMMDSMADEARKR
ncbi:MAG: hypothetical protein HOE90_24080 [Bacteriovoracaceae bacterium]|jgi:coenzyme Q-binding protein COQ10|nr:hypothetical protein [Bacteriovoracaceae bacterium]